MRILSNVIHRSLLTPLRTSTRDSPVDSLFSHLPSLSQRSAEGTTDYTLPSRNGSGAGGGTSVETVIQVDCEKKTRLLRPSAGTCRPQRPKYSRCARLQEVMVEVSGHGCVHHGHLTQEVSVQWKPGARFARTTRSE